MCVLITCVTIIRAVIVSVLTIHMCLQTDYHWSFSSSKKLHRSQSEHSSIPWCVHKCVLGTAVMIICLGHLCHQGLTFIVKQIKESLRPPCGLCTQMCFTPSATLLKAFFALFLHLFMISNANLSNDFPRDVYTSVFNTQRNPAQSSFSPTRGLRQCVLCVFVYQHYHY